MKTCYICGPLTPHSHQQNHAIEYLRNVRPMLKAANRLINLGYAPFCPGLDMLYYLAGAGVSEDKIKAVSMAWLDRSDCMVLLHGWSKSKGCLAEIERAKELGMHIYLNVRSVPPCPLS